MIAKEETLPVRTQFAIAAVNRSTWQYQAKKEPEPNVKLMNLIDEIHLNHPPAASIGSYIHHYSHERPHAAQGGRWPMEVYLNMVA